MISHQPSYSTVDQFQTPVSNPGGNSGYRMLNEFEFEIQRLREENSQLRYQKELRERDFENVMFENNTLYGKLENLENVFIGSAI
jgi:hypothetical protein